MSIPERGATARASGANPPADMTSVADASKRIPVLVRSIMPILLEFERYPESGRRIVQNQPGAVQFSDGGDQRQTEAGTRNLARPADPPAPSEHELSLVRRYSRPVVLHDDLRCTARRLEEHAYPAAIGGELDG